MYGSYIFTSPCPETRMNAAQRARFNEDISYSLPLLQFMPKEWPFETIQLRLKCLIYWNRGFYRTILPSNPSEHLAIDSAEIDYSVFSIILDIQDIPSKIFIVNKLPNSHHVNYTSSHQTAPIIKLFLTPKNPIFILSGL